MQRDLVAIEPATFVALSRLEPTTGRLHEIDLLVLGYSALYLVEIKSGPGRYEGDQVDWTRTPPGGGAVWMEPPLRLANHKAKVLKSRLAARMKEPHRAPRVEALVFLSHPDVELRFRPEGQVGVVTRKNLVRAITHHEFPGSPPGWQQSRIDTPLARDITQALAAIGIRKRKGKMFVGAYELGAVLEDGSGYQDRLAIHRDRPGFRRRARIYRDPFLRQRGAWDPAADRWSAAVTLHEMLTGVRPALGEGGAIVAAERFDPAVRDRLAAFFTRALAGEAERRFPTAKAMKHAWIACFWKRSSVDGA